MSNSLSKILYIKLYKNSTLASVYFEGMLICSVFEITFISNNTSKPSKISETLGWSSSRDKKNSTNTVAKISTLIPDCWDITSELHSFKTLESKEMPI